MIENSIQLAEIRHFWNIFASFECLSQLGPQLLFMIAKCHFDKCPNQSRYPWIMLSETFEQQ